MVTASAWTGGGEGSADPNGGVKVVWLGTDHRLSLAQQLELLKLRNGLMASINFRITPPLKPHHWSLVRQDKLG